MEYQGATIGAIVFFALLAVGAYFMMQPDPPAETAERKTLSIDKVPESQPDKIDEDASDEFIELPSGIQYRMLRKSNQIKPTLRDSVAVAYEGRLESGQIFDSSYRESTPPYYELTPPWQVIDGWKEAIPLCGVGGMMEVIIPPELGYGAAGKPPIPPNATLIFKVEVLKIFK